MSDTTSPTEFRLEVGGMTCGGCASRVEDALASVPGVLRVRVDLAAKMASLTVDPARATPEALAEAVRRAGYKPAVPPG